MKWKKWVQSGRLCQIWIQLEQNDDRWQLENITPPSHIWRQAGGIIIIIDAKGQCLWVSMITVSSDRWIHAETSTSVTWPHTAPALPDALAADSPAAAGQPAALSPWPAARPPAPASQPQSETASSAAVCGSATALPSLLPPPSAACEAAYRKNGWNISLSLKLHKAGSKTEILKCC